MIFGGRPRAVGAAWGILAAFLLLAEFGPLLGLPTAVIDLSPFSHGSVVPGGVPQPVPASLRRRVYEVIEVGRGDDTASKWFDRSLVVLVIANVVAFCLETVPSIDAKWGGWLRAFELLSVAVFTIEYGLRLWTAVEMPFGAMAPTE